MFYMAALGLAIEFARPVVGAIVDLISRWWLDPNHASHGEYAVYFNREYAKETQEVQDQR